MLPPSIDKRARGLLTCRVSLSQITLFDGSRYVKPERYAEMTTRLGLSEEELTARGIFMVHPSFRWA